MDTRPGESLNRIFPVQPVFQRQASAKQDGHMLCLMLLQLGVLNLNTCAHEVRLQQ